MTEEEQRDLDRSVIIVGVVVFLALFGYYQFSYKPAQEALLAQPPKDAWLCTILRNQLTCEVIK